MRASSSWRVEVICDADSHPRKVAKIARFRFQRSEHRPGCLGELEGWCSGCTTDGWYLVGGFGQLLLNDKPAPAHEIYGSQKRRPRFDLFDLVRHRSEMECRLCGLRVEARFEAIETALMPFVLAAKPSARLAAVAASL